MTQKKSQAGVNRVVKDRLRKPLGHEQLTGLSTAKGLTVPTGASYAVVQAEDQTVRWTDDGVDPTSSTGMRLVASAGAAVALFTDLSAVKFIEETASAKVNVAYYSLEDAV